MPTPNRRPASETDSELSRLVAAISLYEDPQFPGQYSYCGHWPGDGDLQPPCDCDGSTGCKRVAALLNQK